MVVKRGLRARHERAPFPRRTPASLRAGSETLKGGACVRQGRERPVRRALLEAPSWHPRHFEHAEDPLVANPNPAAAELAELLQNVRRAQVELSLVHASAASTSSAATPPQAALQAQQYDSTVPADTDSPAVVAAWSIQAGGQGSPRPIPLWERSAHEPSKLDKQPYVRELDAFVLLQLRNLTQQAMARTAAHIRERGIAAEDGEC